jgi:hypothetical protein
MSDVIKSAIASIRDDIAPTNLSEDFIFGLVCYKYFYNSGKFDKSDLIDSYTDGKNDGGIDLVAVNEDKNGSKSLVLIQSKNISSTISKEDIKDIFTKIQGTVNSFKRNQIAKYNKNLQRIYLEKFDDAKDNSNFKYELVLFLGQDKSDHEKNKIRRHIADVEELKEFTVRIFYLNEIKQQIESIDQGPRFVKEGEIDIFKDHGTIKNGDNGLLVDASALSIRNLYAKYKDKGLFEQNFRYFVKYKKIDDPINNSLKNKRDHFWFLNNGIIIACKDFTEDGENIKLYDFSIVNGCQTTTLLGQYEGDNEGDNFPVPCKIVKPNNNNGGDEDAFNEFISEIAEASNSQKPISDRDLKSNRREQRILQSLLKEDDPKVYMEIKRGSNIFKKRGLEKWQKVKNDELGQLILSIILQQPGTARSSKKKIFSDQSTYASIFRRRPDKDTLVDLLQLSALFDEWRNNLVEGFSTDHQNVAKNGKLCILAIIGLLVKHANGLIDVNTHQENWRVEVSMDNLTGKIFRVDRADNFTDSLNSIFNDILNMLTSLYNQQPNESFSSVTNFFKTDKTYYNIVVENVRDRWLRDPYELGKLQEKIHLCFNYNSDDNEG